MAVVVAVVAAHPVRRFDEFRSPDSSGGDIQGHILSSSGNGRWQLWAAAVDEFESKPAFGRGAGSYGAWWLQHRTLSLFVVDAHSLYVEVLGQLGIVGFILIVGAFLAGIVTAVRRLLRIEAEERVTLAAVTATFVAFAIAAGVDWMWELTIVPVVASYASPWRRGRERRSRCGRDSPLPTRGRRSAVASSGTGSGRPW